MALETLKNVEKIGEYPVRTSDNLQDIVKQYPPYSPELGDWLNKHPIIVDHDNNIISFKIQSAPIQEVGINGCQVDTIIETAKLIIEGLNEKFPCTENRSAIQHLQLAMHSLEQRKKNRIERGVEGTSNE
jgi:hypothetical protein